MADTEVSKEMPRLAASEAKCAPDVTGHHYHADGADGDPDNEDVAPEPEAIEVQAEDPDSGGVKLDSDTGDFTRALAQEVIVNADPLAAVNENSLDDGDEDSPAETMGIFGEVEVENLECQTVGVTDRELRSSTVWPTEDEVKLPVVVADKSTVDVIEQESQDVSEKVEEKTEAIELKVFVSTPMDVNLEVCSKPSEGEVNVAEDVDELTLQNTSLDKENSSKNVLESDEHEIPSSTSLDLVSMSNPASVQAVDVVDCAFRDVSTNAENDIKVSQVLENEDHEITPLTPFDMGPISMNTKQKIEVLEDVEHETMETAKCEVLLLSPSLDLDVGLKAESENILSGEADRNSKHEIPSPTFLDLNLGTNPVNNSKEESEVLENVVVECDSGNGNMKAANKARMSSKPVEIEQVPSLIAQNGCNGDKVCATNSELKMENTEDVVDQIDDSIHWEEAITVKAKKIKPFNFLVRVPRFDDECLKEQISLGKLDIEEKTKIRDAIQVEIQAKRANSQIHGIDYEYAKSEGRNARKLLRSKRMEIDSLQAVINKAKNALSIEDIDSQIYNMERMIQHETLALKEEKQLIREIKQLKQLREQLSSNMGSRDEIRQALEQREEVEEHLKIHRKELDSLKDKVLRAEAAAMEAEKKYDDENKKVKELQAHFRVADEVRQAAYAQWQSLRKELSKKSQHHFKYRNDSAVASKYAFSWDTEALYHLCTNKVEDFMELWNANDEFRREYVKFNLRSTVRRFGTLDGRSLGPDEKPTALPSYADEIAKNNRLKAQIPSEPDRTSQFPGVEPKHEVTTTESIKKEEAGRSLAQRGTDKGLVTSTSEEMRCEEEVEVSEKKTEEKETAEAEEAARLKEQRRLEAVAKAHEARERKKRQAEKMQMRVELKTLKEAEQKEKEREKRLRKKERKRAAAADLATTDANSVETAPSSESAAESSSKEIEARKPNKNWLFGKQCKTRSIPPPLRNRNKKKLQQWVWVGVTSACILVMFWLGNVGMFSNVNFKGRGLVI